MVHQSEHYSIQFTVEILLCVGPELILEANILELNWILLSHCAFCFFWSLSLMTGSKSAILLLVSYFKMHYNNTLVVLVKPQRGWSFLSVLFPFTELVLILAAWFVSIVTEYANHARDHLKTEANLDKYDGWVLRGATCCFQAFNTSSWLWHGVDSCLFIL